MTGLPNGRNAFTLIELIVVIAIISLLIGLLLPAVLSGPWGVPGSKHAVALTQMIPIYRCPSASIPEHFDHVLVDRVPGTYLACASGTALSESNPGDHIGIGPQNGVMFADSRIGFRDIFDGTASTIAIGESLFHTNATGPDYNGNPQIVDHWYFASPSIAINETSETMGSTGPAINSVFSEDPAMR